MLKERHSPSSFNELQKEFAELDYHSMTKIKGGSAV